MRNLYWLRQIKWRGFGRSFQSAIAGPAWMTGVL